MKHPDIIIIGAGAAGLIAAAKLSKAGQQVVLLEARRRIGGRVYTYTDKNFTDQIEGGAEFIHGKADETNALLRYYHLSKSAAKGKVMHMRKGEAEPDKHLIDQHHRLLEKKLKALKRDLPVQQFLDKHFKAPTFTALRMAVKSFVEGYESGEMEKFSTIAFKEDWLDVESWDNARVEGGYLSLLQGIADDAKANGCEFCFSHTVLKISWKKNEVKIHCLNDRIYVAPKVLITVPLGVLQKNKIRFSPSLPEKKAAWNELGFGNVIKVQLLFASKWWEAKAVEERTGEKMKKLFFFFSHAAIPTWWTQSPDDAPLLTGWLSGPQAKANSKHSNGVIRTLAMESLAYIFNTPVREIRSHLKAVKIFNWVTDVYTMGGYSYQTPGSAKFRQRAFTAIEHTVFFAGEHLSEPTGTVEGALVSGLQAARRILNK